MGNDRSLGAHPSVAARAERRADRAVAQLRRALFLAGVGDELSTSLELDATVARVARLALDVPADWAIVEVPGAVATAEPAGAPRPRLSVTHANPADAALARRLKTSLEQGARRPRVILQALASGVPAQFDLDPAAPPERPGEPDESEALLQMLGSGSVLALPLVARRPGAERTTLGVATLVLSAPGRRYGPAELTLAQHFARRAAVAVSNALLHERVRQEVRSRDEFLAAFAHDLKNPITSIRAYAQLVRQQVQRGGDLDRAMLAQRLERLESATMRLANNVEDVLEDALSAEHGVPRERGGFLVLRRRPVDLVALVQHLVAEYGPAYQQTRFRLETELTHLTGSWDPVRLERVVGNLLSNAVKYGGAEISVDIATEQRGSDTWVAFTVSDHGLGIPAEDLPHVFDFRWRGSNVRGRVSGAGIGLAAAKRIVEQHGGAIGVESREGQGTTFTVWLPLQPPRTAGRTSHKDTPSTG